MSVTRMSVTRMSFKSVRRGAIRFGYDVGGVLAAYAMLLLLENVVLTVTQGSQFVGAWELADVRQRVSPIALGALTPFAVSAVALGLLVHEGQRAIVAGVAAANGVWLAVGVSTGRHMASFGVRAAFVGIVGFCAAFVASALVRAVTRIGPNGGRRWAGRSPSRHGSPTGSSFRGFTQPCTKSSLPLCV